jgi:hypothetical protein
VRFLPVMDRSVSQISSLGLDRFVATSLLPDTLQLDGDHEGADEDRHLYEAIQLDSRVLFAFSFVGGSALRVTPLVSRWLDGRV